MIGAKSTLKNIIANYHSGFLALHGRKLASPKNEKPKLLHLEKDWSDNIDKKFTVDSMQIIKNHNNYVTKKYLQ
jgi:hypothetical protein